MRGLDHFDSVDRPQVVEMIVRLRSGEHSPDALRELLKESRVRHRVARREIQSGDTSLRMSGTLDLARRKIRGICAALREAAK